MVLAENTEYFSGQGQVTYSLRDEATGLPTGGFIFLGDCSSLETKITVDRKEHMEHQTGKNSVDAVFESAQKAEFNGTFGGFDPKNLELYLYGNSQTVASATITGEALIAPPPGGRVPLSQMPDGAVTLSTGTAGTDYIVDAGTGMILFPSTTTIAQGAALTASYTGAAERLNTAFTEDNTYKFLRFDGLNRASDNKPVIVEVYKGRFNPAEMLALINDDFNEFTLNGTALYDALYANDPAYGGFMRVRVKG